MQAPSTARWSKLRLRLPTGRTATLHARARRGGHGDRAHADAVGGQDRHLRLVDDRRGDHVP